MSNVSGVNHASPTTQQVESVQVQWNSTKPLECALKGIYAASAYLAFPQHPYATAIGFLMTLTSGKTKSVQLQQSGSDAIEEEMARREKLVGQLVWGAVGLGVLAWGANKHYKSEYPDLMTMFFALNAGSKIGHFLQKNFITPVIVEPVNVNLTKVEIPSEPEAPVQEQAAPQIYSTRISLCIILGKEDDEMPDTDVQESVVEALPAKEVVSTQVEIQESVFVEKDVEKLFEDVMNEISDEAVSTETEVQEPVADLSAEEVAAQADIEKLFEDVMSEIADESLSTIVVETLPEEVASEAAIIQRLVVTDVTE